MRAEEELLDRLKRLDRQARRPPAEVYSEAWISAEIGRLAWGGGYGREKHRARAHKPNYYTQGAAVLDLSIPLEVRRSIGFRRAARIADLASQLSIAAVMAGENIVQMRPPSGDPLYYLGTERRT